MSETTNNQTTATAFTFNVAIQPGGDALATFYPSPLDAVWAEGQMITFEGVTEAAIAGTCAPVQVRAVAKAPAIQLQGNDTKLPRDKSAGSERSEIPE